METASVIISIYYEKVVGCRGEVSEDVLPLLSSFSGSREASANSGGVKVNVPENDEVVLLKSGDSTSISSFRGEYDVPSTSPYFWRLSTKQMCFGDKGALEVRGIG